MSAKENLFFNRKNLESVVEFLNLYEKFNQHSKDLPPSKKEMERMREITKQFDMTAHELFLITASIRNILNNIKPPGYYVVNDEE